MKKILIGLVAVVAMLALIFALGPREPVDETVADFEVPALAELDAYIKAEDGKVANLREGSERSIVWANPAAKAKTTIALVYLHGFSANPREVRPLPDLVAKDLDANLYFARLAGHGRDGAAMAEPTANDWLNDTAQAIAIGRQLGEKVVLISTSTGGTLATWALSKPELAEGVAGNVMVSPNFGVQAAGSGILTMPWARQILPMIFGEERAFEPINVEHGKQWTTRYPNVALLPMQASVARAAATPVEDIMVPSLFVFHGDDKVVRSDLTRDVAARWGARADTIEIDRTDDPFNHVIAGDILSPSTTGSLAAQITAWISSL